MGNERSLVTLTLISNESKERANGRSHIHEDFIISPRIKESQFHAFLRGLISNLSLQTKVYSSPRRPLFLGALGKARALLAPRACLKTMLLQAFALRYSAWSQYLCIAKFSSHLFRTRSGRIGRRRCFLFLRAADCPKMIGENGGTKC